MQNGYFQIVSERNEFGIILMQPSEGGEKVRFDEVDAYLHEHNLECDFDRIQKAIAEDKEQFIKLGVGPCPAINTEYKYTISEDGMEVTARIYAPSETGKRISYKDLIKDLERNGIKYGICEQEIEESFTKGVFCTDILVAKGDPVREGHDAYIEYYFNTDPKIKPTINEDGSVDFFHLNTINNCKEGDILARLFKEDEGDLGMTVLGAVIKPKKVKRELLKYGHNIEPEEDNTIIRSMVDGHVTLVDGKVFVSNVLELENIDTSTGNIDFEGSVNISGNVQSNFSVRAGGNIVVKGIVEGAVLEAGGNIIIARGMAGMGKGVLKAGGNVVAKFFENASIEAGGYVQTESSLHSTIKAESEIIVDGKKGFISGGHVCATNSIEAKTLGSHLGTVTIVEVGATPAMKEEYANLQKEIQACTRNINNIDPVVITFSEKRKKGMEISKDQIKYLYSLVKMRQEQRIQLNKITARSEELRQIIERQSEAQVVVKGDVFPGVKIIIGDVSTTVQNCVTYCRFQKIRGDVKMTGI